MTNPVSPEVAKELAEAARDLRSRINETRGQNATDAVLRMDAALAKFDAEQVASSGVTHSDGCWRWHHGCAIEKLERAEQGKAAEYDSDTRRMDWLSTMHVEVRSPLRWGSHHLFFALPDDDEEASCLRHLIDAERVCGVGDAAPVPAPSPVRAPAVVAAQGVTEENELATLIAQKLADYESYSFEELHQLVWSAGPAPEPLGEPWSLEFEPRGKFVARAIFEHFAATRAQQGGEDARDARRYRWLRKQHWSWAEYCVVRDPKNAIRLGHNCPSHDLLDEAIDAAIAAKEGEGND